MNARTIKTQMKKAGFSLDDWRVEKSYKSYNVWLIDFGLSDNERQQMTGDQVIAKRQADEDKIKEVAKLFGVEPSRSGIVIMGKYAPSTW